MSFPKGWELVLIVVVIVLLFGARKLPDAARGLGRSLRIFKAEIKDPNDEEGRDEEGEPTPPAANQAPMITATPVAPAAPVQAPPPVVPVQTAQPVVVPPPEPVVVQPPVQQTPTDR